MRRRFCLLLVGVLVICLAACGLNESSTSDTAVLDFGNGVGFCNLYLYKRGDPWLDGKTAGAEKKHPDIIAGKRSGNRFSALYVWNHPLGRILFKTGYAG